MNCGRKIFQDCSLFIILRYLIPRTVLINSWLTDIVRKCFYSPDVILDSNFQKKYVPAF